MVLTNKLTDIKLGAISETLIKKKLILLVKTEKNKRMLQRITNAAVTRSLCDS